ncbi:Ger(x)C family spore germination protein [Cytobacillus sp. S13-E01]|uniref:Ger(x)C family spore germination protein n=1 Tax=Cytobacillus sp. S13-E01 TaxID=3031326 RepID=UPI0023D82D7E|nr:Ger(x)C family spore germination protein [Cytobacillus sp. S13-E01]MDF0728152.1 Ger(x)C family spore germination protein [Cytobacillus sp. S13-E01]
MKNCRIILVVTIILLTGCADQRILEELGFTHTVSYDVADKDSYEDNQMLRIGLSIPIASDEVKETREILVTNAYSSKESRTILSTETDRILVSGQLRNTLFGDELARKGIWDHIDTLVRDPAVGQNTKIIVVSGEAYEILKKDYKQHPRTGEYIDRLIDKEVNSQAIPDVTIYHFTRDYFDDGIDPVAPLLKENGEHLIVDGIALFNSDKYVTSIESSKAMLFSILTKNFKEGQISVNLTGNDEEKDKEMVMFSSVISKRKIHAVKSNDESQFKVNIKITIHGSVLEYIGEKKLGDDVARQELENEMSKYIKMETEKMITYMQEHNVDSIGIGKYVRNSLNFEEWQELDWNEVYPKVEVAVDAELKIKDYGKFK